LITKRFVQSALFLGSIGDMNLKVFKRFRNRRISATFRFFLFLNKNNKLRNACAINRLSQGLLKFSIKKESYFKNKLDKSSEN